MDLIDRKALLKQIEIDSDGEPGYYGDTWKFIDTIKNLPSATDNNVGTELGTNLAEVGTDCISRQAAIDALAAMYCKSDEDGYVWIIRSDAWKRIDALPTIQPEITHEQAVAYLQSTGWMQEHDRQMMLDGVHRLTAQPEPKRGKWILDRSGAYCCSECMEPCAGYVMMKPRDKFCKMCGAKMEVTT